MLCKVPGRACLQGVSLAWALRPGDAELFMNVERVRGAGAVAPHPWRRGRQAGTDTFHASLGSGIT